MTSDEAASPGRSLWPRLLIAAAAIAYGAHVWVVRADLMARNAVLPLLGAVLLLLYFWGLGVALVRLPALRRDGEDLDPLLMLGLGIGAGALALLGLGSIGLLQLPVFAPLGAAFILFGLWGRPPWRIRRSQDPSFRLSDAPLLAALGVWALLVLVLAFTPDATWDALAYHLATAKIYVQHGRIVPIPWLFQSNFPIGVDLVFLHGLLLGSDQVAVLLALLLGFLAVAATWRLARLFLSPTYALIAVLLFALAPDLAEPIDACQAELGWTTFAVLSLVCALEWRRGERKTDRWLHLSAIFAGLAGGAKLPGLLGGAAVGAIVLFSLVKDRRAALAAVFRFAWIFVLVASPVYVKSWIHTGTPIWPLSLGVFHPRYWNDEIHRRFLRLTLGAWAPLSGASPVARALGIVRLAWQAEGWSLSLFVLFLGASALAWRRARDVWPLLLFALPHLLFWCFVTQQSRFLLPAVPVLVVGLIRLTRPNEDSSGRAPLRIAFASIWVALLVAALPAWFPKVFTLTGQALQLVRGAKSREQMLEQLPIYRACTRANEATPPGSKILLLGENRGYWLGREYMWGDDFYQAVLDYAALRDVADLRARLRELGITHVLVGPLWQGNELRLTSLVGRVLVTTRRLDVEPTYELYDLAQPNADDRPLLVSSSSSSADYPAQGAMDRRADLGSWGRGGGWMSGKDPTPNEPEELDVLLPRSVAIHRIRLASYPDPRLSLSSFVFQYDRGGTWTDIPGAGVSGARGNGQWTFDVLPLETRNLRLLVTGASGGAARVMEIEIE
jgi:hypothetical protein